MDRKILMTLVVLSIFAGSAFALLPTSIESKGELTAYTAGYRGTVLGYTNKLSYACQNAYASNGSPITQTKFTSGTSYYGNYVNCSREKTYCVGSTTDPCSTTLVGQETLWRVSNIRPFFAPFSYYAIYWSSITNGLVFPLP